MTPLQVGHDPRINPKPGDSILRKIPQAKDGAIIRVVVRAHGGFVFFWQDNGRTYRFRITTLDN